MQEIIVEMLLMAIHAAEGGKIRTDADETILCEQKDDAVSIINMLQSVGITAKATLPDETPEGKIWKIYIDRIKFGIEKNRNLWYNIGNFKGGKTYGKYKTSKTAGARQG